MLSLNITETGVSLSYASSGQSVCSTEKRSESRRYVPPGGITVPFPEVLFQTSPCVSPINTSMLVCGITSGLLRDRRMLMSVRVKLKFDGAAPVLKHEDDELDFSPIVFAHMYSCLLLTLESIGVKEADVSCEYGYNGFCIKIQCDGVYLPQCNRSSNIFCLGTLVTGPFSRIVDAKLASLKCGVELYITCDDGHLIIEMDSKPKDNTEVNFKELASVNNVTLLRSYLEALFPESP